MPKRWINSKSLMLLAVLPSILTIVGCTTDKDRLLPHGDDTILQVWERGSSGSSSHKVNRQLLDARQSLRRPFTEQDQQPLAHDQAQYTRQAQNEIYSQFHRLPNPDLVMYVFPHLAGTDPVPVPGYSTVFPLYQRVQYAMPGERTEPY